MNNFNYREFLTTYKLKIQKLIITFLLDIGQLWDSACKGVMDLNDCFDCALRGDNKCGYDYVLIREMMNDEVKEARRGEIHVTDLTGCLLKAYLDKVSPAPEYIHETLARWLGTNFHSAAEGSDALLDSELPLEWNGIVGKSDVVYKDGRIVDFKFTRWMYVNKLPYGSHATQVNIYAWMLRKMGRKVTQLQIQYVDASGPTKCRKCRIPVRAVIDDNGGIELKCPKCGNFVTSAHLGAYLVDIPLWTDEEVESLILERKENLEAALAMNLPPTAEPGFLCAYCAHRDLECFPDVTEE